MPDEAWGAIAAFISAAAAVYALVQAQRADEASGNATATLRDIRDIYAAFLSRQTRQDTPLLDFDVDCPDCASSAKAAKTVLITVTNLGAMHTQIREGRVSFESAGAPEQRKHEPLKQIQVGSAKKKVAEWSIAHVYLYSAGIGIESAEVICHAIYTRDNKPDATRYEKWHYNHIERKFNRVEAKDE
jgi:hypothetical protein